MHSYKVLVSIEILQLSRLSRHDRDQILSFLESLIQDPFKAGDYQEHDQIGRPVQIKIIGRYALTYWADHAVKEIKVVRVARADHE